MQALSTAGFTDTTNTVINLSNGITSVIHIDIANDAANDIYFQFFDSAAADVTLGTTKPMWVICVKTLTSEHWIPSLPIFIGTRLSCAATSSCDGNGAAAAVSNHLQVWVN